jgi:hypothetical protein
MRGHYGNAYVLAQPFARVGAEVERGKSRAFPGYVTLMLVVVGGIGLDRWLTARDMLRKRGAR